MRGRNGGIVLMCPLRIPSFDLDSQRHAALGSMADLIGFRHAPEDLFRALAPHLQSVLPVDVLNLALGDPVRKVMKLSFWEGSLSWHAALEVPAEESPAGSAWRNQNPALIDMLRPEKKFDPELQWLREHDIRSYCLLPLTDFREKLGALGFASRRLHAFRERDMRFLHSVTEIVALGVDSALDEKVLAEEAGRLRLLIEAGEPRARNLDLPQSLASILASMQRWAVEDYIGIYLYDKTSHSLRLHMSDRKLVEKMAPQGLSSIESTLAGQAFRTGRNLILDYSSLSALPFPSVKSGIEMGVRSLCLFPLLSEKVAFGVLKVARRQDRPFSPRDIETLEKVTGIISSALEPILIETESAPPSYEKRVSAPTSPRTGRQPSIFTIAESHSQGANSPAALFAPNAPMDSEQLLSAYLKASKVGLCILDTEFRYLAVNETLAEMNGVPSQAHLGKSVREILGDFAALVEPQFRRLLATGESISDIALSFVLPGRTEPSHWIEHYIPIKDATGKITQIGVIAVEVTEQKNLEESLRGISENLRLEKKRQQVLLEVSRLLSKNRNVQQTFPQISAYLRRVLRQEYAALALHAEGGGQLLPHAVDFPLGKSATFAGEIGTARGPGGKALEERSSLIFGREEMKAFDPKIAAGLTSEGLKALCCVPLLRPKGALGVLLLGSTRADAFHSEDLSLLNQVAAQLAIALENAAIAREVEKLRQRLDQEQRYLQGEARTQPHFEEIIGESPALQRVLDQITVISASEASVLLLGETGTGKGLIARAIHSTSKRKGRNFITLNCAAIPTGLLESELFGHEKGAFTGAISQKIGRLELADQGTLFLDEIGEIPLEMQPKLLRVLQDHEFERLGGTRTIKVDLRLIAATNRDLAKDVAQKHFRSDLFYRLNVFPIRIPSLRERREDIPLLIRYFVRKFSQEMGREIETIPSDTMDRLMEWRWPGNVRELENFIERSVILTDGTALRAPLTEFHTETADSPEASLEATERDVIIRMLRETKGLISGPAGAARRLGLKRTTLQSKMQRLGITREDYSNQKPE